jgi:N-carbamoyl-L-amino-acid hydrolase
MLEVNFDRLQTDLQNLSEIGRDSDHGLYRMAFSEGDMAGRAWLKQRIQEAGLELYEDGAANIHARLDWDGKRPSVMTGSHIDTVPGAGHLDGALGVVTGLECLRCIKEEGLALRYPLELVSFTDEEGRFGGLLGSQAICGQLSPEKIYQAVDLDGISLTDIMSSRGLNAMDVLGAQRNPDSIYCFVELHIEQGPVLDRLGKNVGVVEAIAGLFKWNVRFIGHANHAGTTPMSMRQDAFQGLAEFATQMNRILEENGSSNSVATIGKVELFPGAANVVPGTAEFSLEVRDTDQKTLDNLGDALRRTMSAIARRRGLMFEFDMLSQIEPVKSSSGIVDVVADVARKLDLQAHHMPSGAAHDTQIMANITRAGMIFVPSKEGKSHSPAEWTALEDIRHGANTLLNTLYQLAGERA